MITFLLVIAAVIVIGVIVAIARQPSTFHLERSIAIAAPASRIFPRVNTSQAWDSWSPWKKHDPDAVFTFDGPPAGVGAITRFAGKKSGTGTSTNVESRPSELIRFRLDMVKPFRGSSDAAFTFISEGKQTIVTWSLSGPLTLPANIMRLFIDCDAMCGAAFTDGLNALKQKVEGGASEVGTAGIEDTAAMHGGRS